MGSSKKSDNQNKAEIVSVFMLSKLSGVPLKPGVYIFKSARERVLYVGKAKNLRNRLRSYFRKSAGLDDRKTAMLRDVRDFSYIVTDNEFEAFVLEANLIKHHKPRFNIILRDDKNYPYLRLAINEEWPYLEVVRKVKRDGSLYFGPYIPSSSMWEMLAFIRRHFRIRDCSYSFDKPMRPCIQHQIGRCLAPCAGLISREDYLKLINEIKLFLSGEKKDLIAGLEKRMLRLSGKQKFEEAAVIRDRIKALEKAWGSQKVVAPELGDMDVVGFYIEGREVSCKILFIRNGIMIGSKDFYIRDGADVPDRELIHTFITQFYSKEIIPPSEILTPLLPNESGSLEKWLGKQRGKRVKISAPSSGKKKELLGMATENAELAYRARKDTKTGEILNDLKERLRLAKTPQDIGAFDVSNISGNEAVGSFVYWSGGEFNKDMYRRLKIKDVHTIDDYSMMKEIIGRVIRNLEGNLPDLVVIDGGRGHLEIAGKVFRENSVLIKKQPFLIAVAKDPDRIFQTASGEPLDIEDGRPSSFLLKRIRDEAHRFAIGYHRKLREKALLTSPLEKIKGIGKKRRLELLRVFGSIENIKKAPFEEISRIKGFNKRVAENLLNELRRT